MRKDHERQISGILADMKSFEQKKAQGKFDAEEEKRFKQARQKAAEKKGSAPAEQNTAVQERKEFVRQVRNRVTVLVERMGTFFVKAQFPSKNQEKEKTHSSEDEPKKYLSYEDKDSWIRD